ncbi:MAG: hypothetical protein V4646_12360 [Pseudomonadota bacterium]
MSHAVATEAQAGGETETASDLAKPIRKARAKLCQDLITAILKSYFFDNRTYEQIVNKYCCSKGAVSKYVKLAKDEMATEKVEVLNEDLIARICADKAASIEPDVIAVHAAVSAGSKVQTCWEQYVQVNPSGRTCSRTEFYNKYKAWKTVMAKSTINQDSPDQLYPCSILAGL